MYYEILNKKNSWDLRTLHTHTRSDLDYDLKRFYNPLQ